MKLTREQAQALTWDDDSGLALTVERDEQVGSRRWVSEHVLTVKDSDGRYWETCYERGLTEYQDIAPFEESPAEVEFYEVAKVPVTTYEYKEVKP